LNYFDQADIRPSPTIGILLCTFNGARHLSEQLNSIANQNYPNWRLFVSDDGSTDETLEIIQSFKKNFNEDKVVIFTGPGQGPTKNFLSLTKLTHKQCDYFAFCDQDDFWYKNKLSRALESLKDSPPTLPAMYCSSTSYISDCGIIIQNSYIFLRPPSFKNALVQSIAGGNTMVFNQAAASLVANTPAGVSLVAHDWWTYILVAAFSGKIHYDPIPTIDYRQHSRVLVGENRSLKAKIIRIRRVLGGEYKSWNTENLQTLTIFMEQLPIENQKVLNHFQRVRSKFILVRLYAFIRSGVRRQTFLGNVALFIGVLLNRV